MTVHVSNPCVRPRPARVAQARQLQRLADGRVDGRGERPDGRDGRAGACSTSASTSPTGARGTRGSSRTSSASVALRRIGGVRAAVDQRGRQPPGARRGARSRARRGRGAVAVEAVPLNPIDINVAAGRFYGGHPPVSLRAGLRGRRPGASRARRSRPARSSGRTAPAWARDGGTAALAERSSCRRTRSSRFRTTCDPALAGALGIAGIAGLAAGRRTGRPSRRARPSRPRSDRDGRARRDAGRARARRGPRRGGGPPAGGARAGAAAWAPTRPWFARRRRRGSGRRVPGGVRRRRAVARRRPALGRSGRRRGDAPRRGGARIVNIGQSAGPAAPLLSADVRGKELTILGFSNFGTPREVMAPRVPAPRRARPRREGRGRRRDRPVRALPRRRGSRQAEGAGVKLVVVLTLGR